MSGGYDPGVWPDWLEATDLANPGKCHSGTGWKMGMYVGSCRHLLNNKKGGGTKRSMLLVRQQPKNTMPSINQPRWSHFP